MRSSSDWSFLKENIKDYHDKALADYIIYGFPLGLNPDHEIVSNATKNHSSARDYLQAVTEYIQRELDKKERGVGFQLELPNFDSILLQLIGAAWKGHLFV